MIATSPTSIRMTVTTLTHIVVVLQCNKLWLFMSTDDTDRLSLFILIQYLISHNNHDKWGLDK